MALTTGVLRRHNVFTEAFAFLAQVMLAISVEVGDDLGRGFVSQHGTPIGNENALSIVAFETHHGFWVEPAWQLFFEHAHRILVFSLTWGDAIRFWNTIYIGGHVFVTLGTACWVYFYRREFFGFARNTMILTNIFALVIYERFPTAPPRLTSGLTWHHRPFVFQDTVFGAENHGGIYMAQPAHYNEFSAFPSVHMAWALIVGAALVLLARPVGVRICGALYPALMLAAVVVTGNHYLTDALAAVVVVLAAAIAAAALERYVPLMRTSLGRARSPN